MTVEHVLLPTDGSDASRSAEDRGIRLALNDGARLTVLHVLEDLALPVGEHTDRLRETLTIEVEAFVERVADRAEHAGVEGVEGVVRHGRADKEIVSAATELDCDAIVLGTHGRSEREPYLLGGVTSRVLRHSAVPVFVVPTHADRRPETADGQ
jgi:nucleotide-binding universal stress UspA family protein